MLQKQGLREATDDEAPDRTVIVGPSGPWIAVYDEATESQDTRLLETLAKALSKSCDTHAVTVLVHDSDVLDLRLLARGARVDQYCRGAESLGPVTASRKRAIRGKPEAWIPVLAPGKSTAQLEDLMNTEWSFAELALDAWATALGIDAAQFRVGFNYLQEEGLEGQTSLRFCKAIADVPLSGDAQLTDGFPPSFVFPPIETAMGGTHFPSVSLHNRGITTTGVRVELSGDAVRRGLLRMDRVRTAWRAEGKHVISSAALERLEAPAQCTPEGSWTVELPLQPLAYAPTPRGNSPAEWTKDIHRGFSVMPEVTFLQAGEGEVVVRVIPLAYPSCAFTRSFHVTVHPAPRKPLKVEKSHPGLLDLERPYFLIAMVCFSEATERTRLAAARGMEKWLRLVNRDEAFFTGTRAAPGKRASAVSVSKTEIPDGKAWKKITELLLEYGITRLECHPLAEEAAKHKMTTDDFERAVQRQHGSKGLSMAGGHGVVFERAQVTEGDDAGVAPSLTVWTSTVAGMHPRLAILHERLNEWVESVVADAPVHQAFRAEWNWKPLLSASPTLYEQQHGVDSRAVTLHAWNARHLRALGSAMWLSESLAARIDLAALGHVAQVSRTGALLKVVPDASRLDLVERALELLLPDAKESHALGKMDGAARLAVMLAQRKRKT